MAGKIFEPIQSSGSGIRIERDAGSQDWLREIADLTEAFVGNTIETLCAIDNLPADGVSGNRQERRSADVKARLEALEDLLVQLLALRPNRNPGQNPLEPTGRDVRYRLSR